MEKLNAVLGGGTDGGRVPHRAGLGPERRPRLLDGPRATQERRKKGRRKRLQVRARSHPEGRREARSVEKRARSSQAEVMPVPASAADRVGNFKNPRR